MKTLQKTIRAWQRQGQTIVLVTGVFDLLHIEHLRFLTKAKAAGDKLVVGIETDIRVKQIKGPDRPVNNQSIRLEQLQALKAVDHAFLLPQNFSAQKDWEKLIATLKPNIYAVSSSTHYLKNKRAIIQKFGGQLKIVHSHNPAISTSLIIAKIINPHIGPNKPVFTAKVITGHGRGKDLGYPTLNLIKPADFPYQHGIYAGWVWFNRRRYPGAFHFGPIPAFNQNQESLEVYALTSKSLSVPPLTVRFQLIQYLRPIKAFASLPDLSVQISQDVQLVKVLTNTQL
jgi:D-glycero-beta-D-manno-heptose 1-phosphate adenylyltransferase